MAVLHEIIFHQFDMKYIVLSSPLMDVFVTEMVSKQIAIQCTG